MNTAPDNSAVAPNAATPDAASWRLTPSHILEYLYCPRFTYFEYVLGVPEHQEKRFKVLKGREVHELRKRINPNYLRRKLGVVARELDVELEAPRLHLGGRLDELLTLDDGTMAPFDYKYAVNKQRVFRNHRVQAALYALLISENRGCEVRKAFLCYTRSRYEVVQLPVTPELMDQALAELRGCLEVIQTGIFPQPTAWTKRCTDCCYRKLCTGL